MRFALGLLALALAWSPAAAAPDRAGRTTFEVLRNGEPFGAHTIVVTGDGESLTARTEIRLRVAAGPLTFFRYEQDCTESWRGGALASLECSTLKEGRRTRVRATRDATGLIVDGAEGPVRFAAGAMPSSWWIQAPLQTDHLISTETGARLPVRIERLGRETIQTGSGPIAADRVRVHGTLTVDLWYDEAGRWVGCAFRARGQNITYRLISPPSSAPA